MMTRLKNIVAGIASFNDWTHADKLRLMTWSFHEDGKDNTKAADYAAAFDVLHLPPPKSLHRALQALEDSGDLLKSAGGYRLAKKVRDRYDQLYGKRPITVEIHTLLESLPGKLSSADQAEYLDEALKCLRVGAWRSAVLTTWCVVMDHFIEVVMKRLPEFNKAYADRHVKKPKTFSQRSDFKRILEGEIIELAYLAGITDKTQNKCLEMHLDIRNDAGHPSGAKFTQVKAEAFISDVIDQIVLGMPA